MTVGIDCIRIRGFEASGQPSRVRRMRQRTGVGFLVFLQVFRSSPLITNVPRLNETLLYVANFTAMNPKRWRLVRNLALLVALLVTAIQLYFIAPIFLDLFDRLPIGNNAGQPAADPSNESRLLTSMVLQVVGLPSWVLAFLGWRMGRRNDGTQRPDN